MSHLNDTDPTPISALRARSYARVTGEVRRCTRIAFGSTSAFEVVLGDGTGELALVFVGRRSVPGFVPDSRVFAEGRVAARGDGLVVLNPRYRFLRARAR